LNAKREETEIATDREKQILADSVLCAVCCVLCVFEQAPEMDKFEARATRASDVWAYGATLMEVLCGQEMEVGTSTALQDLCQLVESTTLKTGRELAVLLDLVQDVVAPCLREQPGSRPSAKEAVTRVNTLLAKHVGGDRAIREGRMRLLQACCGVTAVAGDLVVGL
jgi:serine/threonine protein kinase